MKWLLNALSSSVGRKFLMAITGLLLCGFLVAHLAGNLLLFAGAETYNLYAHKLHEQKALLLVAEIGLFGLFVAHIVLAFRLTGGNTWARGQDYAVKKNKGEGDGVGFGRPDSFMFVSGLVILGFLILHLSDFKFGDDSLDPYAKARAILRTPLRTAGYLTGFLFLFLHLLHGVASTFQTLGINHKKYNFILRAMGVLFAASVSVGFASCVGWAWGFTDGESTLQKTAIQQPANIEREPLFDGVKSVEATPVEVVKPSQPDAPAAAEPKSADDTK